MSKARSLLLASVALGVGATSALSADLPTKKGPPPAPVIAPFSWTGFDVGLQGGYGWGVEGDDLSIILQVPEDSFTAVGPFGGVHAGYNQQFGSFVLGLYGEVDAFGLKGSDHTATTTTVDAAVNCSEGCTVTDASLTFRNTWQAFLLARGGVAFDRWLFFVTGGLALGDDHESVYAALPNGGALINALPVGLAWTGSQTNTLVGGAIGLGAEYAFDAHWRFGAEWRFVDFPRADYSATDGNGGLVRYKAGFTENLALVSLSYGF